MALSAKIHACTGKKQLLDVRTTAGKWQKINNIPPKSCTRERFSIALAVPQQTE
ncbi:MAG: hypothetical protein JZU50_14395 [Desulfobulbaceae bacterium]|nr:hypothetical protein [Desulfobulbaceae bacterium]